MKWIVAPEIPDVNIISEIFLNFLNLF